MGTAIVNLDLLIPEKKVLILDGKEINYSVITSGIALKFIEMKDRLIDLADDVKKDDNKAKDSFNTSAEICALVTSAQYEEMTKEWLLEHTVLLQLKKLIELITEGIMASLESFNSDGATSKEEESINDAEIKKKEEK